MNITLKDVTEFVTAATALIAAIQAWRAHGKAEKALDQINLSAQLITQLRAEVNAKQVTNVTINTQAAGLPPTNV
jgi:hypothetical protein